jgi:NAD(P)-dependent dehydrogenase (short-subunit alcohol dehydrogenase family)
MVLPGASSGIGLVTTRMTARRGARLVLTARKRRGARTAQELNRSHRGRGGECRRRRFQEDVRRIAEAAVESLGGFDTRGNTPL